MSRGFQVPPECRAGTYVVDDSIGHPDHNVIHTVTRGR